MSNNNQVSVTFSDGSIDFITLKESNVLTLKDLTNIETDLKKLVEVSVPEGTEIIGERSFFDFQFLKRIILPKSLLVIEEDAFYRTGITKLIIPDSVVKIGDYAFEECKDLNSIVLSKNLKYLGYGAFYGCKKIKEITLPENITYVEGDLLAECKSLKKASFLGNLETVDSCVFKGCEELENVYTTDSISAGLVTRSLISSNINLLKISKMVSLLPKEMVRDRKSICDESLVEIEEGIYKLSLGENTYYIGLKDNKKRYKNYIKVTRNEIEVTVNTLKEAYKNQYVNGDVSYA